MSDPRLETKYTKELVELIKQRIASLHDDLILKMLHEETGSWFRVPDIMRNTTLESMADGTEGVVCDDAFLGYIHPVSINVSLDKEDERTKIISVNMKFSFNESHVLDEEE